MKEEKSEKEKCLHSEKEKSENKEGKDRKSKNFQNNNIRYK